MSLPLLPHRSASRAASTKKTSEPTRAARSEEPYGSTPRTSRVVHSALNPMPANQQMSVSLSANGLSMYLFFNRSLSDKMPARATVRGFNMKSILYAEDDDSTRTLVTSFLTADGFAVEAFPTADELLEAFGRHEPDLVLLDVMLSGTDGLEALARIRRSSTVPVMLLTAKGDDIDVCSGLALGGDDYLAKPFNPMVLVSRVRALMRRVDYDAAHPGCPPVQDDLTCGNTRLDRRRHAVYVGEQPLLATPTELRLIIVFMENHGEALSRQQILEAVWRLPDGVESRTLDETCRRVRVKLARAGSDVCIQTVRGFGYRLTELE